MSNDDNADEEVLPQQLYEVPKEVRTFDIPISDKRSHEDIEKIILHLLFSNTSEKCCLGAQRSVSGKIGRMIALAGDQEKNIDCGIARAVCGYRGIGVSCNVDELVMIDGKQNTKKSMKMMKTRAKS